MKTNMRLLLGGLVLSLASSAMATTLCGSAATANNGQVPFTSTGGNSALVSGGGAMITCSGFTVPPGDTLVSITFTIRDDAQGPNDVNSQVQFVWTYSGTPLTPAPGATVTLPSDNPYDGSFAPCQTAPGGTINCNANTTFSLTTSVIGLPPTGTDAGTFSFTVTPSAVGGDGYFVSGNSGGGASAQVFATLNYIPTSSVPEPASLLLIGGGLIGLGVFARRKRQS